MGLRDLFSGNKKPKPDPKQAVRDDMAQAARAGQSEAKPPAAPQPPEPEEWAGQGVPQELQPREVRERLQGDLPPILLDVREEMELRASGCIPGCIHIPMSQIEERWQELDPQQAVVVYCASGMRSFDVGFLLIEKGFKEVANLNGGIQAWDGPVERKGP